MVLLQSEKHKEGSALLVYHLQFHEATKSLQKRNEIDVEEQKEIEIA